MRVEHLLERSPRERVLKVLHGGVPDRVPVMPGYGTWYASRICGGDLFDIEEGRMSAPRILADITRKYGCEIWYWQGYGDELREIGSDGAGVFRSERIEVDADNYAITHTWTALGGAVSSRVSHSRTNPAHALTGFIKDAGRDWPVYRACRGDEWEWARTTSAADIPPDDLALGITSFVLSLPVDFWKDLRCDTSAAIMDMCDGERNMVEAMEWHERYSLASLAARLRISPLPDMIHLQGSSSSLSVISPGIYRTYNLRFINAVCQQAHAHGLPVQIHHCGKSARLVEILCGETEVDIIHPLEPPPGGDVDLKDIKARFGHRLVLMGNLNTFQLMAYGTPQQVKEAARRCIDDAAEGGRFILTNGDQIGRDTPEANVVAMVEAAHEYGSY